MDPVAVAYWLLPAFAFLVTVGGYLYLVYRRLNGTLAGRSGASRVGAGADPDDAIDRDAGTVACPDCGAENELEYTYCRRCVGELPVGAAGRRAGGAPSRRGIF